MRKDILDLVKGTPAHRVKAKKAHGVFDQSERFIVKGDRSKEGSRGGNVIGHTSSGKAIYASSDKHGADHKHLDAADHKSAHEVHHNIAIGHNDAGDKAMAAGNTDKAYDHWHASDYHMEQSEQHEFAHHKKAGKRLPGHLAHWRESGGPPASDGDLRDHAIKINQQHNSSESKRLFQQALDTPGAEGRALASDSQYHEYLAAGDHDRAVSAKRSAADYRKKSEAYTPDLVKGGWHSIPGGKHGGERRKHGAAWEYRYPDHNSRKKAVSHHENKGYELRNKAQAARRSGDRAKAAQLEDQAGDHMHAADSAHANNPQSNQFSGGGVHVTAESKPSGEAHHDTAHGSGTKEQIRDNWMKMTPDQRGEKLRAHRAKATGSKTDRRMQLVGLDKQDAADIRKLANEVGKKHGVKLSIRAGKGSQRGTVSIDTYPDPATTAPRLELLERLQNATLSSGKKLEANHHMYDPSHTLQTEKDHSHVWDHTKIEIRVRGVDTSRSQKSVGDNPDLVKGKGGWQPIPGGKHGGERKRGSYGHWEYRYPSKEAAKQSADHHESKRKDTHEKIEAHNKEYDFDSPSFNWDKYDEHGEAESEKLSNDHSHHADQRDAARHFAQHGHGPATYLDSYDSHSHHHDGEYDDEERQRGWNYAHPKNDSHGYTVTQSGDKNKFEVHHGERHGHGHVEASEKVGTARSREAAMAMLHRHAKTPLPPVKKSAASDLQKAIVAYDQAVRSTK